MQEIIKIEGSIYHQILSYISWGIAGYLIGIVLVLFTSNNIFEMTIVYGIIFAGPFLSALKSSSHKELYIIEISDEYIKGPSTGHVIVSIPIEAINREKTFKHSTWKKFIGCYRIHAKNGVLITIDKTIFSKVQLEQIYNTLTLKLNLKTSLLVQSSFD